MHRLKNYSEKPMNYNNKVNWENHQPLPVFLIPYNFSLHKTRYLGSMVGRQHSEIPLRMLGVQKVKY